MTRETRITVGFVGESAVPHHTSNMGSGPIPEWPIGRQHAVNVPYAGPNPASGARHGQAAGSHHDARSGNRAEQCRYNNTGIQMVTATDWSNRTGYDSSRYREHRDFLVSIMGGTCVICGATQDLEFDHIDPVTKEFSIASKWSAPMSVLAPELVKCQLLCSSCHDNKSDSAKEVAHGQGKSGKKNCKCTPCRARKALYMHDYKALRKLQD
jgi:5-methylcytosine-specific restriction endonuclease McrA